MNSIKKELKKLIPDKIYIKYVFQKKMKTKLNLKNPKTFNEKIQWLKLYDRKYWYSNIVDKYKVRKYVNEKIEENILVPLIGVYDSFEDINFSSLPTSFVLKTTHNSGDVFIIEDIKKINIKELEIKVTASLKTNYYYLWREFPYKNIRPRIIIEKIIRTKDEKLPMDYKFHCFNGKVDSIMVCTERETGQPKYFFVDKEWRILKYNKSSLELKSDYEIKKPERLRDMIKIAEILSTNFNFIRVDLYCENNIIYFGELTFYPQSGFDYNILTEADIHLGNLLKLSID